MSLRLIPSELLHTSGRQPITELWGLCVLPVAAVPHVPREAGDTLWGKSWWPFSTVMPFRHCWRTSYHTLKSPGTRVRGSGAPVMGGWLQNWRIQCRRTQFRGHWTSLPQESQGCGNQCKSLCDTGRPRYKSIHKSSSVMGKERLSAEKHKHFCM